jgi:trans-aconitate methyltransferase
VTDPDGGVGTAAADATFYDLAYADADGAASLPYQETPMRALYDAVYGKIRRLQPVVDLGCGNGLMAQCLKARGYCGDYLGLDFSDEALAAADRLLEKTTGRVYPAEDELPEAAYRFTHADLREWAEEPSPQTHDTVYLLLEVLEHLDDDVGLICRLPARSSVLFSVPNFWSHSHVRTFDRVGDAFRRYGHLLDIDSWQLLPTGSPQAAIHLYGGRRRASAW